VSGDSKVFSLAAATRRRRRPNRLQASPCDRRRKTGRLFCSALERKDDSISTNCEAAIMLRYDVAPLAADR